MSPRRSSAVPAPVGAHEPRLAHGAPAGWGPTSATPYSGPIVVLTVADAERLLPLLEGREGFAPIVERLAAAVVADPSWWRPIR